MGIDYKSTVFIVVRPPSKILSAHRASNRAEHDELLDKAKQANCCLYYATTVTKNGKQYAKQPWVLDSDSVVNPPDVQPLKKEVAKEVVKEVEQPTAHVSEQLKQAQGIFFCKTCGKKCSSQSGLTLHYKASKPCSFRVFDTEQDIKEQAAPKQNVLKQETNELSCPFCGKKVSSTPGRTLHVKNAHPDKLEEYHLWLKQHGKS